MIEAVQMIMHLESLEVTVHVISVNLRAEESEQNLQAALNHLALFSMLEVIHAANVLEDQLILNFTTKSFS